MDQIIATDESTEWFQAFLPTAANRPIKPSLTMPISSTSR
jgi:hypothetical protein